MLRPSPSRLKKTSALKPGFSKAASRRLAQRMTSAKPLFPESYVVVDLKTTGLDPGKDEIIEIGALKVQEHDICDSFSMLIRVHQPVPPNIVELTGITDSVLAEKGLELPNALSQFLDFVGLLPVVSHNADFDYGFLRSACARCGVELFSNKCVDTLSLSKRVVREVKSYKLATLAEHFGITFEEPHRSADDCRAIQQLYEKLIPLLETR
jgi:DNA polymerase III epsilon subunit family exonuclease